MDKYRKVLMFLLPVVFVALVSIIIIKAVNSKSFESISPPDKIIIYKSGIQKEIDKKDSTYKTIIKLTNERFPKELNTVLDIITNEVVGKVKKDTLSVEFIYNNEQKLYIGHNNKSIKFYKMLFPLVNSLDENKHRNITNSFQYGDKENYKESSISELKESKELIYLLNDVM